MRVMFLAPFVATGGAERQLSILLRGLGFRGCEVGVIFQKPDNMERTREILDEAQREGWWLGGPFRDCDYQRETAEILRAWNPDVVVAHDNRLPLEALEASGAKPRRVIWQVHCVFMRHLRLANEIAERVTDIVCVSEATRRELVYHFPALEGKAHTVRNGVPLNFGDGARDLRHEYGLGPHPWRARPAAFVGRYDWDKGAQFVAEAVQARPQWWGIFGGWGLEGENLRQKFPSERLHWKLNGCVAKDFYATADVVVLPSHCEGGVWYTLLEAASMGRPVIATGISDVPELFRDGEHLLLCEWEAESVGAALDRFDALSGLEQREMGRNAQAVIREHLSADQMLDGYLEVMGQ
jgi:glycosyltransferase involved in cell wall biosynthesis